MSGLLCSPGEAPSLLCCYCCSPTAGTCELVTLVHAPSPPARLRTRSDRATAQRDLAQRARTAGTEAPQGCHSGAKKDGERAHAQAVALGASQSSEQRPEVPPGHHEREQSLLLAAEAAHAARGHCCKGLAALSQPQGVVIAPTYTARAPQLPISWLKQLSQRSNEPRGVNDLQS